MPRILQTMSVNERLALSVGEACGVLGVSRSTIYRMLRENRIKSVHIGRRVLIPVTEIKRLVDVSAAVEQA